MSNTVELNQISQEDQKFSSNDSQSVSEHDEISETKSIQYDESGKERLVNISAYKFTPVADRLALKAKLKDYFINQLPQDAIRGSILISTEGCNINLSGYRVFIDKTKEFLHNLDLVDFKNLVFKETDGGIEHNYRKLRLRLKEEIVTMKRKDVIGNDAPRVDPKEFQQWIDNREDFYILDVRNDYEQSVGTFKNAIKAPINIFNDFPSYASSLLAQNPDIKQKKIVTVCTGGIKTEKSTLALRDLGCNQAFMLDGGILKYFEEIEEEKKKDSYLGDCFVYDRRVAVRPDLSKSDCVLCEVCTWPLTIEEQNLETYVPGVSCKYCLNAPKRKRFTLRDIQHDPNAPKKPKSSFILYCEANSDKSKDELGRLWKELSYEEKGIYVKQEQELKQQYKKEVQEYLVKLSEQDYDNQKRKYTKYNDGNENNESISCS